MSVPDFTPEQADRWVEQEAAKANTREKITKRIADETNMLTYVIPKIAPPFPNGAAAHRRLVEVLEAKLKDLA